MRKYRRLLFCGLALLLLTGCGSKKNTEKFSSVEQLNSAEYRIGVPAGAAANYAARKYFTKEKELVDYNSVSDGYTAVECGKLDAFVFDTHVLEYIAANNPKLIVLNDNIGVEKIVVGATFGKEELIAKVNEFIAEYKADGTYEDMYARWMTDKNAVMPQIGSDHAGESRKKVLVGIEGYAEPMNYYGADGELTGFDVEFVKRLGEYLGVEIEICPMNFDALIPSTISGKLDLLISNLNETDNLKQQMLVSDSYVDSYIGLIVSADRADKKKKLDSVEALQQYLDKKTIGVTTGTLYEQTAEKLFPSASTIQFKSDGDVLSALKTGKIDAMVSNYFASKELLKENQDLYMSDVRLNTLECAFAVNKENTKLQTEINETIANLKKSGKYDEIYQKWIEGNSSEWAMPTNELSGENGTICIATTSDTPPFSTIKNNEIMGFDIEILYWAAYEHGYSIETQAMDFGGLIPALASGKADVAANTLVITPERAQQVLFTDTYITNGHNIVFHKEQDNKVSFFDSLKSSVEKTFVKEDRWKMVLKGIQVTLILSVCSAILGSLLGFGICMLRRSKRKALAVIAKVYIRIMQGTPILVFLMILYYIIFGKVDISAMIVAVIAFSINFAAYTSEMMRSGIDAVAIGQTEAAYAMGCGKVATFFRIVFPQAAKNFMPVYRGEIISLVKSTSIVGYIAIQDLTKVSDIIRSRTYEAFFPLIATAIIYFAISYLLMVLFNLLERRISNRGVKKIMKEVAKND